MYCITILILNIYNAPASPENFYVETVHKVREGGGEYARRRYVDAMLRLYVEWREFIFNIALEQRMGWTRPPGRRVVL